MHDGYVVVGRLDEIRSGTTKRVILNDIPVLLANVDGTVYAVDELCTLEDSLLSPGFLKDERGSCTLHGSRFSVISGEPQEEPATGALLARVVRVEGDSVLVQAGA